MFNKNEKEICWLKDSVRFYGTSLKPVFCFSVKF